MFTENVRHSRGECKKAAVVELTEDQQEHEEFVQLQMHIMDMHQTVMETHLALVPQHVLARQLSQKE